MARFNEISKGTRAIKRVTCPIVNAQARANDASAQATADTSDAPPHFECGVRVLRVDEIEEVYQKALARTKRLGGEESDTSALYNLSLQLYTIAAAYVDPDSDPAAAKLYFGETVDDAVENILKSELLSRDTLAYLAEVQEKHQDSCNPQSDPKREEMWRCIEEGAKNADFFLWLRPSTRIFCLHTMANMLLNSQSPKSSDSLPSGSSGIDEQKRQPKPRAPSKASKSRR